MEEVKKARQIFFCPPCNMQFTTRKLFAIHQKKPSHVEKEKSHPKPKNFNRRVGIYVKGYPADTKETDLVKYFTQFGSVTWVHFGRNFLLLDFSDYSSADTVMAKKVHFLNGKRLTVRYKDGVNVTVTANEEEVNRAIVASLADLTDFDSEFQCLLHKLQPDQGESLKKYNSICHDLYTVLKYRFPGLEVQPFGSTLTGLGFNDSDIDVYLDNVKRHVNDEVHKLAAIKKTLQQSGKFGNCLVIPNAKIPLIKCLHLSTGIKIDINIKNKLGVLNSRLIGYYLGVDGKLKPVVLLLKFWAKCHKLTGQNHLLTNYCLALMFVFFMQQEPYKLPSVAELQQNCPNNTSLEVWSGDFIPDYNFHSEPLTSSTPLQLLSGFFEFYSHFPFTSEVICPFTGSSLPRTLFLENDSLSDTFQRYKLQPETLKLDSALCVQDPFEHSRNIAVNVSESVLERFVSLCHLGSQSSRIYQLLTVKPPQNKVIQGDVLHLTLVNKKFELVDSFLTMCLKDFLALEVKLTSKEPNKKIYICTGKVNLWHARKTTAKQLNLDSKLTLMEREAAVTAKLKESTPDVADPQPDILAFKLTVSGGEQDVSLTLEKVNPSKKSHHKSFNVFFAANFPNWLQSYEKDTKEDAL